MIKVRDRLLNKYCGRCYILNEENTDKDTETSDPFQQSLLQENFFTRKFIVQSTEQSDLILKGYNFTIPIFLSLLYIVLFRAILEYTIPIKTSTTSGNDLIIFVGKWFTIVASSIMFIFGITLIAISFKPLLIYLTRKFRIKNLHIVSTIPIESDEINLTITCDYRSGNIVSKIFKTGVSNKFDRERGLFTNSVDIHEFRLPYYGRITIQFNDIETSFSPVIRIIPSLYSLFSPEFLTIYIKS